MVFFQDDIPPTSSALAMGYSAEGSSSDDGTMFEVIQAPVTVNLNSKLEFLNF